MGQARTSAQHQLVASLMEDRGRSHMESSAMHLFVACALVFGLAALLIVGFASVAQDLLSRDMIAGPSSPDAEDAAETAGQSVRLSTRTD